MLGIQPQGLDSVGNSMVSDPSFGPIPEANNVFVGYSATRIDFLEVVYGYPKSWGLIPGNSECCVGFSLRIVSDYTYWSPSFGEHNSTRAP